jgi:DNA topoisomerase-1
MPRATRPRRPARYTEASLVKRLEKKASAARRPTRRRSATIQRRGYISRQGKALVPSFTAFAVTRLLRNHFGDYVDIGFTAEMEEILDKISNGEKDGLGVSSPSLSRRQRTSALEHLVEDKGQSIEYPIIESAIPREALACASAWPYGPFLQLGAGRPGSARVAAEKICAGRPDARKAH